MKSTSPVLRRTVLGATALVAASLISLGASAAQAETPANSQPAQEAPDWNAGPNGSWGNGAWVAPSFEATGSFGDGDTWNYTGGGSPSIGVNADFAQNLGYSGGCYGNYGSTQVVCYD